MKSNRMLTVALAGLAVIGLAVFGLVAGRTLAQDEDPPAVEAGQQAGQVIEREFIAIETDGGGAGFPFERALRGLIRDGGLTQAGVDSIMADLSNLSDAVDYQATTSPDGNEHQVEIKITIEGDDASLRPAMEQALNNAVTAGLLTAEQAAAVLAEVDAAPDPAEMATGSAMQRESIIGGDAELLELIDAPLQSRLDAAVTAGTITADEAAAFRDILQRLLATE